MYYPKSQITSNLSTNGEEFQLLSTGEYYTGKYFSTSDGKFYTGATPQDGDTLELIKPQRKKLPLETTNSPSDFASNTSRTQLPPVYIGSVKGAIASPINPKGEIILPTEDDYTDYEYLRYFLQQKINKTYLEVSKSTYDNYTSKNSNVPFQLYTPIQITWALVGKPIEVYEINRNIIALAQIQDKLKGFSNYFKGRYLKYYRPLKNEYYTTKGGELKVQNTDENYAGYYHVFPTRGVIMEGRFHSTTPHRILIPFKGEEVIESLLPPIIDREVGTSIRKNIASKSGY